MPEQYLTEKDLFHIKSVIDCLKRQDAVDICFDCKVIEANGDTLGTIRFGESGYAFFFNTVE
jgi:hypothetical protein